MASQKTRTYFNKEFIYCLKDVASDIQQYLKNILKFSNNWF